MIIVDTGALIALIDRKDPEHASLAGLFRADPQAWILPWAILPEVDYLLGAHISRAAQSAFLSDLADGAFQVEWGRDEDLVRARQLDRAFGALRLGLTDGVVIAIAERLGAAAIATLDLRHFGAVPIKGGPKLLPRDS